MVNSVRYQHMLNTFCFQECKSSTPTSHGFNRIVLNAAQMPKPLIYGKINLVTALFQEMVLSIGLQDRFL